MAHNSTDRLQSDIQAISTSGGPQGKPSPEQTSELTESNGAGDFREAIPSALDSYGSLQSPPSPANDAVDWMGSQSPFWGLPNLSRDHSH